MKNLILILTCVSVLGVSSLSSADLLRPSTLDHFTLSSGGTVVDLNGGAGSATSEIFGILEKAGVAVLHQFIEGRTLEGQAITASVFMLNGARFTATFNLGQGAQPATISQLEGKTVLRISGAAAEELYTDMTKAGLPVSHGVDTSGVVGKNLSCSALFLGHGRYSCSITATGATPISPDSI